MLRALSSGRTRPFLFVSLLVVLAILALAPTALAGRKPGGGGGGGGTTTGGGTLSLVYLDGATAPRHDGRITFNVSTGSTDRPYVGLRCYQGSNFVYDGYVGYFPTYMFDPWFVLDSPYWADGVSASCTARLFYFNSRGGEVALGSMSFTALP